MEKDRRKRVALLACVASVLLGAAATPGRGASPSPERTVCSSGCTYSTIQAAVDAAVAGDVITIGRGTYSGAVVLTKPITLAGAGAKRTTVAGTGSAPAAGAVLAVQGAQVAVTGLTIAGGGTGVSVLGGSVAIRDSSVSRNAGAAVSTFNGSASLYRSTVTDNGQGISASYGSISVRESIIDGNGGAGLVADRGSIDVSGSKIRNNRGSGIVASTASVLVVRSTISGNSSPGDGGGITLAFSRSSSSAAVVDSIVTANTAARSGGGIFIDLLSRLTLRNSTVARNVAVAGGGIYRTPLPDWWSGPDDFVTFDNARITGNTPDDCRGC